jgi:hypothetical protein
MSDCSAIPDRLVTYGRAGQLNNRGLSTTATALSAALDGLIRSSPDPRILPRFPDWGQDLTGYASRKDQIDRWVEDVGGAFKRAGDGADRSTKGRVTVGSVRLDQLITAREPQVRAALDYFRSHIKHDDGPLGGNRSYLEGIDARLAGLSPEQLDEFIRSLSDGDLKAWNAKIANQGDFLWYHEGLGHGGRVGLANLLFTNLSPDQLKRLGDHMPVLQPDPSTQYIKDGFNWKSASQLPLFDPKTGTPNALTDINQGDDGDCWFLAGLGSVAMANPQFIVDRIRPNPNGTYTVTFYKDGHPVPITVTDSMPYSSKAGFDYPYAHDNSGNDKWVMIYEKAFAQFSDGYGKIDGGWGDISLGNITGQPATRSDVDHQSLAEIDRKLHSGYALTGGTNSNSNEMVDNGQLVSGHEYMIKSVDVNHHTVTLVNPWGPQGAAPHEVTLSEADFKKYFGEVSYAQVK